MQKLDPKVVWIFFVRIFFRGLFLFIFLSYFLFLILVPLLAKMEKGETLLKKISYLWWLLPIFILYLIFCYIWAKLTYRFWGYQLTKDAFKKEHGVIWKKYVSIPYERIQNIDIHRGILARILGLSDLKIQTAGYSAAYYGRGRAAGIGAEGYLPGLDKQVAEQLREELIRKAKGTKQGL